MSKVLIVDDDLSIRDIFQEFLEAEGHEVRSAANGSEAFALMDQRNFDVVLSDMNMPGYSGMELLSRIRAVSSDVQVVFFTGYPSVDAAAKALREGAFDYLAKPVNRATICRVVNRAANVKMLKEEKRRLEEQNHQYQEHLERLVEERTATLQAVNEKLKMEIYERNQIEEALRKSHRELQSLSQRLTDAEEAERQRISREVHDTVGQTLSAVGINLCLWRDQLSPESSEDYFIAIDDALRQIEEITDGIRSVIADLRPPMLDDYGLLASLQWYMKDFAKRTGLRFEIQGEHLKPPLPISVAMSLFRIAQEALNNVYKHAKASRVTISLTESAGLVTMALTDDGNGFDLNSQKKFADHWGLIIMRERAVGVGATFRLESAPGCGAAVRAEWNRAERVPTLQDLQANENTNHP